MKWVQSIICVTLGLVLFCQFRILKRLDTPFVIHSSSSLSAVAIATEVRKQIAEEERRMAPVSFQFESRGGTQQHTLVDGKKDLASGGLRSVGVQITCKTGAVTTLKVNSPGVKNQVQPFNSAPGGYRVSFDPETGAFLPREWTFSVQYKAANGNDGEVDVEARYLPGEKDYLELKEKP